MRIEEAVKLLGHIELPIVQWERVATPALEQWVIAEPFEYHEMAHSPREFALLSFGLWCRTAQLAQVAINDDGMSAHVGLLTTKKGVSSFLVKG